MSGYVRALHQAPVAAAAPSWRRWGMVVLAGLGTAVAAYLTWVHYSGALALCADAGGCETVQASRFATVAGVPVALLGLALYAALLGLAAWHAGGGADAGGAVALALFGLALAGTLYSAYLTYLELFVIGAVCPWCVSSAVLVSAIWGLAGWDLAAVPSDGGLARPQTSPRE